MRDINYEILRSKRRSLSVTVSEGRIIVKAPQGMPEIVIQNFLREKQSWIGRKLAFYDRSFERFGDVKSGTFLLDGGLKKPVVFGSEKNRESEGVFYLKDERSVRSYYEKTRGWAIIEQIFALSKRVQAFPEDIKLCDFKGRWGSCDAAHIIKLNWRLTMLPPDLRDYILTHELCHIKEMNHSSAFWQEVGKYCPDYKKCRQVLKEYSFLTLLYRKQ